MTIKFPEKINNEKELDFLLSYPYPETVQMMAHLDGDIMILGVGGKMGPTLAGMIVRACSEAGIKKKIIGVSQFRDAELREKIEGFGVETIKCDLTDIDAVHRLPDVKNIIFMAGRKFGEKGSETLTWMINAVVPGIVGARFRNSRIVVFSTGCVYPLVSPESGGCSEKDASAPIGEYANSCLGRERIFQYYCEKNKTPMLFFRLNYAVDLRYGVLADIAQNVYEGRPVNISVDALNFIWQGDANNRALLSLKYTAIPPTILNVTGAEIYTVRELAEEFGKLFEKKVIYEGEFCGKAYLSNAGRSIELFGNPRLGKEKIIKWTAEWIKSGGKIYNKPTHFSVTDGQFLD